MVKKKPKPKPKVIVKKASKKPVKVTGNKAKKKAPKPKNTKSGMAKTQRKPDFKLAGKKKPGKRDLQVEKEVVVTQRLDRKEKENRSLTSRVLKAVRTIRHPV